MYICMSAYHIGTHAFTTCTFCKAFNKILKTLDCDRDNAKKIYYVLVCT